MQAVWLFFLFFNIVHCSQACAIPDSVTDTVLVTGGYYKGLAPMATVYRYGEQGWLEDLPSFIYGRYNHACTFFLSSDRVVSIFRKIYYQMF